MRQAAAGVYGNLRFWEDFRGNRRRIAEDTGKTWKMA
jgi:hypothetical protein